MSTMDTQRINVTFPKELLDDLRKYVPSRERNRLIVEATEREIKRRKFRQVLDAMREEPIWADEDHPDLMTGEDVNRYIRELHARPEYRLWEDENTENAEGQGGQNG
jgi:hypothetical protein